MDRSSPSCPLTSRELYVSVLFPAQYGRHTRDGDTDLILQFNIMDTGIGYGNTSVSLTGETGDGQEIQGTGVIKMVGVKKN